MSQVPATTPESDALSKDLKKRGFSFVGSIVIYAHMQAAGLVNDHTTDCFRHPENGKSRVTQMKVTSKTTTLFPQSKKSLMKQDGKSSNTNPSNIRLKRIYESPSTKDGARILVDRLWPRGLSKEAAHVDLWLRDIAPSTALRKWFNHEASRWAEFSCRYAAELNQQPETVEKLRTFMRKGRLTLLFSAKDQKLNNATALKAYLETSENHELQSMASTT